MTEETPIIRATLTPKGGKPIKVHFNPVSLQYQVTNQMQQRGGGQQQHVSSSTGKLTMDLVFDTTHSGADVRVDTGRVVQLMEPGTDKKVREVTFEWGAYSFVGTVESYKETIDFFAPSGIPLRAAVNLTLAATKQQVFKGGNQKKKWAGETSLAAANTVEVPARPQAGTSGGATSGSAPGGGAPGGGGSTSPASVAAAAGAPGAARGIGVANGAESLRFGGGAPLTVSGAITLSPPVAFASGGAGLGIGAAAGAGIGVGGGLGIGGSLGAGASGGAGLSAAAAASAAFGGTAGAGFGASADAGFGASAGASFGASAGAGFGASAGVGFGTSAGAGFGASAGASFGAFAGAGVFAGAGASAGSSARVSVGGGASAGVAAAEGAFVGLGVRRRDATVVRLDVEKLLPPPPESGAVATEAGARFAVGGRALSGAEGSIRADVGASADFHARVTFAEG